MDQWPAKWINKYNVLLLSDQHGGVAVIVAMLMTLLLGVMAFTLDGSYLYMEKNSNKNAVEAAAMAGAAALCDDDPVAVATYIAEENGLDTEEGNLSVVLGYYDENNGYGDFSEYKDFIADPDSSTAANEAVNSFSGAGYQYNNAVLVTYSDKVKNLSGGLLSAEEATVAVAAVAFLRRYDMLALGDDGIKTTEIWGNGHPGYEDMVIHANNSIQFNGTESFSGGTEAYAVNSITGGPGTIGVKEVEIPPIDWQELETAAGVQGQVYSPDEWDQGDHLVVGDWTTDSHGNRYINTATSYLFWPREGDHGGAVYYFAAQQGETKQLEITDDHLRTGFGFSGLTIASELPIEMGVVLHPTSEKLIGGEGSETMYVYSQGDILYRGVAAANYCYLSQGTVFRSEKEVTLVAGMMSNFFNYVGEDEFIRVVGESIVSESNVTSGNGAGMSLNGLFGPPCPPTVVKLGLVEATD